MHRGENLRILAPVSRNFVYFDLETQRTANDVGGWDRKDLMGLSVGVTYSTATGEYSIFDEEQADELVRELERADLVIGFNVINFDYEVLRKYTAFDLAYRVPTLDLLVDIEKIIGHRLKLDALASGTFGVGKTGDGLDAIKWYREGKMAEIAEYCCFDVKVTRLVHEHGIRHGELFYADRFGRPSRVEVNWEAA